MITPIERLGGISPLEGISPITKAAPEPDSTSTSRLVELGEHSLFGSIFQSVIQNVKDTNADFVQNQYLLSTGQLDNPATLMIAATKYSTSVNLLIQLRNKALDVYSELTRLSI